MADGSASLGDASYPSIAAFAPAWRSTPSRACPRCVAPMRFGMLFGVTVDRCDAHGYWFDPGKLQSVLYAAAPKPPPEKLGPLKIAGGILDGLGTILQIVFIFLP
jgi:hypothetical protein